MIVLFVIGLGILALAVVILWSASHAIGTTKESWGPGTPSARQTRGQQPTGVVSASGFIITMIGLVPVLMCTTPLLIAINSTGAHVYTPAPEAAQPALAGDALNHRQIAEGDSKETIIAKLGEPALIVSDTGDVLPGFLEEEWLYPIRLQGGTYESQVRAPLLTIYVDSSGVVTTWGFVHPVTGEPLAASESERAANSWLNNVCGKSWGPRVNLGTALNPGVTRKEEVLALMGDHGLQPWAARHPEQIFVRPDPEHGGEVLTYPVDHPSALYLPSFYVAVDFDEAGSVWSWSINGYCGRNQAL